MIAPSDWIVRHAALLPSGRILDLACGRGRHARFLADAGHPVLAVDRDADALMALAGNPFIETRCLDLEGQGWPLAGEQFAGIVVSNYLWRPRLHELPLLLRAGGVLLYETFMQGNADYGRPSNPDFLLAPGELRDFAEAAGLHVHAFVEGYVAQPKPAMRQAICAIRSD